VSGEISNASAMPNPERGDRPEDVEPHLSTGRAVSGGRDDAGKLVMVANAALVGVPAAYAMSRSVVVTAIAAVAAIFFVVAYLIRRRR
jgi:hypothetical protein